MTLVGNNKVWNNVFTATAFTNADEPLAIAGSGGVNRREDLILGEQAGVVSKFPLDVYGVSASGYVPYSTVLQEYAVHTQSIRVQTNHGRDQLFELSPELHALLGRELLDAALDVDGDRADGR